jgi:hypothetical protein
MYAWRRSGTRPLRAPASSTPKQPIMARPAARAMRRAFDSSKRTKVGWETLSQKDGAALASAEALASRLQ